MISAICIQGTTKIFMRTLYTSAHSVETNIPYNPFVNLFAVWSRIQLISVRDSLPVLFYLQHRAVNRTATHPFVRHFEGLPKLGACRRNRYHFDVQINILRDNILHSLTFLHESTAVHAHIGISCSKFPSQSWTRSSSGSSIETRPRFWSPFEP